MAFILNQYDIEEAQKLAVIDFHRPNLQMAVLTLARLMEYTNNNSDGWAYWKKPVNASTKLQKLVETFYFTYPYRERREADLTAAELSSAYATIKAFLTREKIDHALIFPND